MAKIYYIDSENVGDSWIRLLEEEDSRFLVFYTERSPRMTYSHIVGLMNAANKPQFVECYEGNNGLDFQLVSYMGYEIREDNSNEMIIVSNDTGFDAVVRFWSDRGIQIKRTPLPNSPLTEEFELVSDDEFITGLSSAEVTETIYGVDKNELCTIINCIGKKDPAYIHVVFTHFYGNKDGANIYQYFRKEEFEAPQVTWSKQERMQILIELIIKYREDKGFLIPDSLPAFMFNHIVADKKAMGKKLENAYGNLGPKIYKMFKPFFRVLAKINK